MDKLIRFFTKQYPREVEESALDTEEHRNISSAISDTSSGIFANQASIPVSHDARRDGKIGQYQQMINPSMDTQSTNNGSGSRTEQTKGGRCTTNES